MEAKYKGCVSVLVKITSVFLCFIFLSSGILFAEKFRFPPDNYPETLLIVTIGDEKQTLKDFLPLLKTLKEVYKSSLRIKTMNFRHRKLLSYMKNQKPLVILTSHSLARLKDKSFFKSFRKLATLSLNKKNGYRALVCRLKQRLTVTNYSTSTDSGNRSIDTGSGNRSIDTTLVKLAIPNTASAGFLKVKEQSGYVNPLSSYGLFVDDCQIVKTGSHFKALTCLVESKVDFACISEIAYERFSDIDVFSDVNRFSDIEVIYRSSLIDFASFYVPGTILEIDEKRIQRSLVTFGAKVGDSKVIMEWKQVVNE